MVVACPASFKKVNFEVGTELISCRGGDNERGEISYVRQKFKVQINLRTGCGKAGKQGIRFNCLSFRVSRFR